MNNKKYNYLPISITDYNLLEKEYIVYGIIRRSSSINTKRIDHLYSNKNLISEKVKAYITCWSIIPSLWSALILIFSHNITIIILALCFLIVQFVDEFIIKYLKFPIWYLFLRRSLSIVVIFILIFSYFLVINV